jgi:hypothetical protein
MSHVANVEVEVTDLDVLKKACEALGIEFREGQRTWKWYGKWMDDWNTSDAAVTNGYDPKLFGKGEHAIRVPGATYEIGVVKNPTGNGYRLIYDNYGSEGRKISERLGGMKLTKLNAEYTATLSARQLRRKGFRVTRTVLTNGSIKLKALKA